MEEDAHVALDPNFVPDGWLSDVDDPSSPPPAKKKKLSLSLTKARTSQSSASRFAPPVSEVHYVEAAKGVVPMNTKKNNAWGEKAFRAWVEERNKVMPPDPVPDGLLACHDSSIVSKYMRYFVLEAMSQGWKDRTAQ